MREITFESSVYSMMRNLKNSEKIILTDEVPDSCSQCFRKIWDSNQRESWSTCIELKERIPNSGKLEKCPLEDKDNFIRINN